MEGRRGASWSDDELAMLRSLAKTMSTRRIGEKISRAFGTKRTGNAVIGMAHRAGIDLGGKKQANRPKPAKASKRPPAASPQRKKPPVGVRLPGKVHHAPRASYAVLKAAPPYSVSNVPLGACRWIEGSPTEARPFACDQPAETFKPYCSHHMALADGRTVRRKDGQALLRVGN